LLKTARTPRTSVGFVLPLKHIGFASLSVGVNGKSKLIAPTIVAEK
jgi:hypothetical protein